MSDIVPTGCIDISSVHSTPLHEHLVSLPHTVCYLQAVNSMLNEDGVNAPLGLIKPSPKFMSHNTFCVYS